MNGLYHVGRAVGRSRLGPALALLCRLAFWGAVLWFGYEVYERAGPLMAHEPGQVPAFVRMIAK